MGGGVIAIGEGRVADKAAAYKENQIILSLNVYYKKRPQWGWVELAVLTTELIKSAVRTGVP